MSFRRGHVHRRGRNDAREGGDEGGLPALSKRVVTVYETQTPEGWDGGPLTTLARQTVTQVIEQTISVTEGEQPAPTPPEAPPRMSVGPPALNTPTSASIVPSSTSIDVGGGGDDQPSSLPSAIMASTASPVTASGPLALATPSSSSTFSPSGSSAAADSTAASAVEATQSASSGSSSGSSDGATKAGIAIGVLAGILVILGLVYFAVIRKKKQMKEQQRLADDEKLNGPFGDHARAPPTPAKAPRLSLRPMTQLFLGAPNAAEKRASRGPQQSIAMVASPTMRRAPGASAWERPTTSDSQDVHNPFGIHAETIHEEPPTPRNPATPMTPISEVSMVPSPTSPPGLAPAPRASAITTDSAVLAPIITHSPPLSPLPPQQGASVGTAPAPLQTKTAGDATSMPATPGAATVPASGAIAGATAMSGLQRKQSVRKDNTPAPLDLTLPSKLGPVPPSPAGTEFSMSEVESGQAPEPSAGAAAIAAAGGPAESSVHRVQLDFKPTMDDEMELHTGEVVRLLHEYDDGWALCIRLDRSQQGVVPRTCLSTRPVKPRPPQQAGPRGPPVKPQGRPPGPPVGGQGGPGPNQGHGKPHPLAPGARGPGSVRPPMGPGRPGPPRPMGPQMGPGSRPQSPAGQRPQSPAQRSQSPSRQGPPRSQSPNGTGRRPSPPGPSGMQQEYRPDGPQQSPSRGPQGRPQGPPQGAVQRKPVPGQAY